jgi:hypothetical protein
MDRELNIRRVRSSRVSWMKSIPFYPRHFSRFEGLFTRFPLPEDIRKRKRRDRKHFRRVFMHSSPNDLRVVLASLSRCVVTSECTHAKTLGIKLQKWTIFLVVFTRILVDHQYM